MNKSAIVIGGGVTGLSLGWALHRAGRPFHVLEHGEQPGGAIRTNKRDGYLVEAGPNSLLVNSPVLESLLRGMGLGDEMVEPRPDSKKRYILRDGRFQAAPMGPRELISSNLLSNGAKLRMLADIFAMTPHNLAEESLGSFVRRHFGLEVLDYVVNPFVGGIYAGDPSNLSAQHAFPMLAEAERDTGSVLLGLMKKRKEKKAKGHNFKSYSLSFKNGMQSLTDTLGKKLGNHLVLSADVTQIEKDGDIWRVHWKTPEGDKVMEEAQELFITIPAHCLAKLPLPKPVHEVIEPLSSIEYPPVASVALGYDRSKIGHALDGFGGLIPQVENRRTLGVLFSSTLFDDRAPFGKSLLTVFIGGSRQPELAGESAEELVRIATDEMRELLGVRGEPEFSDVTVWPQAIPQYRLGYGEYVSAMELAEREFPGLRIMGNYRDGIAVGQCILNAVNAIEPVE
ncbi:MAG: protoporphyrinogen oxidase [Verrucomicrobiota bacterium]